MVKAAEAPHYSVLFYFNTQTRTHSYISKLITRTYDCRKNMLLKSDAYKRPRVRTHIYTRTFVYVLRLTAHF